MAEFPALNRADFDALDAALAALLKKSEATVALLVEKAGYLIHQCGDPGGLDATTFATLGANAFNAVQFMASLLEEPNFTSLHQQGEHTSTLMLNVNESLLLVVVFPNRLTLGAVKYYAVPAARTVAAQLQQAAERGAASLDLSLLDPKDVRDVFARNPTP